MTFITESAILRESPQIKETTFRLSSSDIPTLFIKSINFFFVLSDTTTNEINYTPERIKSRFPLEILYLFLSILITPGFTYNEYITTLIEFI